MIEQHPASRENFEGDVVPFDDCDENEDSTEVYRSHPVPSGVISPEDAAVVSLAVVRNIKKLNSKFHHPSMAGDSVASASESHLGEAAQAALDVYEAKTAELQRVGATFDRATGGPHFRKLLETLTSSQAHGRCSHAEANSVIALVRQGVVRQRSQDEPKPVYNDL